MSGDAPFRIGVVNQPIPVLKGSGVLVVDLLRVLEPFSNQLYLISGNIPDEMAFDQKIHIVNHQYDTKNQNILLKTFKYLLLQIKMAISIIRLRDKIDIVFFYIGGKGYVLAHIAAKILKKKTIVIVTGSASDAKQIYSRTLLGLGGPIFAFIMGVLEKIAYSLADQIIAETKAIVVNLKLTKFEKKIRFSGCFFNNRIFGITRPLALRKKSVGYVGRLSEEKGILNLFEAIPLILKQQPAVDFLILGDGQLRSILETRVKTEKLSASVKFIGWVDHDQLINYYNQFKLLVIPSYFESVPIVALEAMSCGTPVLATPVGGIPDVIQNFKTGMILADNSKEAIASGVLRALEYPGLEDISQAARAEIERGYTYTAASKVYRTILEDLVRNR
jgi:glycosyltransferase involved in cell wall biosynthesis